MKSEEFKDFPIEYSIGREYNESVDLNREETKQDPNGKDTVCDPERKKREDRRKKLKVLALVLASATVVSAALPAARADRNPNADAKTQEENSQVENSETTSEGQTTAWQDIEVTDADLLNLLQESQDAIDRDDLDGLESLYRDDDLREKYKTIIYQQCLDRGYTNGDIYYQDGKVSTVFPQGDFDGLRISGKLENSDPTYYSSDQNFAFVRFRIENGKLTYAKTVNIAGLWTNAERSFMCTQHMEDIYGDYNGYEIAEEDIYTLDADGNLTAMECNRWIHEINTLTGEEIISDSEHCSVTTDSSGAITTVTDFTYQNRWGYTYSPRIDGQSIALDTGNGGQNGALFNHQIMVLQLMR